MKKPIIFAALFVAVLASVAAVLQSGWTQTTNPGVARTALGVPGLTNNNAFTGSNWMRGSFTGNLNGATNYNSSNLVGTVWGGISNPATGGNKMTILANGNVGVGVSAPAYLLDVNTTNAGNISTFRIRNGDNTSASSSSRMVIEAGGTSAGDAWLQFSGMGASDWLIGMDNSDSDKLKIGNGLLGSADKLTIDVNGNVGIGTSSPDSLLNISKADLTYGINFDEYSTTVSKRPILSFRKSNSNTQGTLVTTQDGDLLGQILGYGVNNLGTPVFENAVGIFLYEDGAVTASSSRVPGKIEFWTSPGTTDITPRMVIKATGNVGIGTTTPTSGRLVVDGGGITFGTDNTYGIGAAGANRPAFIQVGTTASAFAGGLGSSRSNRLTAATITVTASPFNWTNTANVNVVVYVDGISVTGTLGVNGGTVFNSIGQNTIMLQTNEWTTITYTLGSPTATWKPF